MHTYRVQSSSRASSWAWQIKSKALELCQVLTRHWCFFCRYGWCCLGVKGQARDVMIGLIQIPSTSEAVDARGVYTVFNIHVNGCYHGSFRYSQMFVFHHEVSQCMTCSSLSFMHVTCLSSISCRGMSVLHALDTSVLHACGMSWHVCPPCTWHVCPPCMWHVCPPCTWHVCPPCT